MGGLFQNFKRKKKKKKGKPGGFLLGWGERGFYPPKGEKKKGFFFSK